MAGHNTNEPKSFWNDCFSHIYVEEGAAANRIVRKVLDRLPNRKVVPIKHYKDVFNRPGQEFLVQKNSPKLILALRKDNFLYEGAPVCERFGHDRFYYATQMMNCLYNCAYCYLQTQYPSANVVAFVNPEEYFTAVEAALPAYVSISYDADILALEHIFGYVEEWAEFARSHKKLTLEVRTKSVNFKAIAHVPPAENMILAWTLSPQSQINEYEDGTPSLSARIESAKAAIKKGWTVRLCLDPILKPQQGKGQTGTNNSLELEKLKETLKSQLPDAEIITGSFRMSGSQYKKLRKLRPELPDLM